MATTETIEGLSKLNKRLRALGAAAGGKVLRSSANRAMNPVVKAAKLRAPIGTTQHKTYRGRLVFPGFLSRNIKKKTSLSRDKTRARVSVGASKEAFYGVQFVERGTKNQSKNAWLEPAFENQRRRVLANLTRNLQNGIQQASRK